MDSKACRFSFDDKKMLDNTFRATLFNAFYMTGAMETAFSMLTKMIPNLTNEVHRPPCI